MLTRPSLHKSLNVLIAILFLTFYLVSPMVGQKIVHAEAISLRPPFNPRPGGATWRVTSYFDHYAPNYNNDSDQPNITVYTGETTPSPNKDTDFDKPYSYYGHPGYDFGLPSGTEVFAAAEGIAYTHDQVASPFGRYICIAHTQGLYTLYAHLNEINVANGASVTPGQRIGLSGTTGTQHAHLHFAVQRTTCASWGNNDRLEYDATDPFGWRGYTADPLIGFRDLLPGQSATCLWRSNYEDPFSCEDTIYEDGAQGTLLAGVWNFARDGNGYHRYWRYTSSGNEHAEWHFDMPNTTRAAVYAFIPPAPTINDTSTEHAIYGIYTAYGWVQVPVNQRNNAEKWVWLGTFVFNHDPVNNGVILMANTGEPEGSTTIGVDAIKFRTNPPMQFLPVIRSVPCTEYDEILFNGDFENGTNYWFTYRNPANGISFLQPRSDGQGSAIKLGGSINTEDFIDQGLYNILPNNECPIILSFEGWIISSEPSTTVRYDDMRVEYEFNVLHTLLTVGNDSPRNIHTNYTIDLNAYKGTNGYIRFRSYNDGSYPTEFWIDNVSIKAYR